MGNFRKTIGNKLAGKGREWIPNKAFHIMVFIMKLMDVFINHSEKTFRNFGVKPGQIVVDYGCGPARYIDKASRAVREAGHVYAVDTHPIAIKMAMQKIRKTGLQNVTVKKAEGYNSGIPDREADTVLALDIFHMIEEPTSFLVELHRITRPGGSLFIQDGHQSRAESLSKIEKSACWKVVEQTKEHIMCTPVC